MLSKTKSYSTLASDDDCNLVELAEASLEISCSAKFNLHKYTNIYITDCTCINTSLHVHACVGAYL